MKCDNWPRKLLGENVFSSRQTTNFLLWSTTLLPSKSNQGFQSRLLDQQGVKSCVKLEARVITNCVSEAKCSCRGGGSEARAGVRLAWSSSPCPSAPCCHPVPGTAMRQKQGRNLLLCEAGACVGDMPSALVLLLLLCSVKPKFTQAQFHLVAMMFFWPWNLLLDWNLYRSQKKF